MIVSFAVTNFRSIRERMELTTVRSALKGMTSNYFTSPNKKQLLRSAVIYGPNASGKTNFLMALNALEFLVLKSASFKPDEGVPPYEPHKLEKSSLDSPVTFEISFVCDHQYDYQVSFNDNHITSEELHYYPSNTKSLLYSRQIGKDTKFGDYFKGPKKTVERLVNSNQLLLSKAIENNPDMVMMNAFRFFAVGLRVFPMIESFQQMNLTMLYAKRLAENKDKLFARRFNAMICALDTGISSVSAEKVDWNEVKFPGNMPDEIRKRVQEDYQYDIRTQHFVYDRKEKVGIEDFDINDESAGTKSLFIMGGIILDTLSNGRVLVVDEFEKNLHPNVTSFLIELFHNPEINKKNAQLIFATHDITQLSNDRFRRDQVWFSEKDEYGSTTLLRCSNFQGIRLTAPLDKWYVSGRFGATPIINDVDFLIEMQRDEQAEVE